MTWAQGIGRHTEREVTQMLEKDLQSMSDFLGRYMCRIMELFEDILLLKPYQQLTPCARACHRRANIINKITKTIGRINNMHSIGGICQLHATF